MLKKQALRDVSVLWLGSISGAVFSLLIQIVLARRLGPDELGVFASIHTFIGIMIPFVCYGIDQLWNREFGRLGWGARGIVSSSLKVVFINLSVAFLAVSTWIYFSEASNKEAGLYYLMMVFLLGQVLQDLTISKKQLEENFLPISALQSMPVLSRLTMLILIIALGFSVTIDVAIVLYALTGFVVVLICLTSLIGMLKGNIDLKGHGEERAGDRKEIQFGVGEIYRKSWPFCLVSIFNLIYFQLDIVLVRYLNGSEETGYYSVAYNFLLVVLLLPMMIYRKYLSPKMHRWAFSDRDLFHKTYSQGCVLMLFMGIFGMLGIWLVSPNVVPFVFGADYERSVEVLGLLALSLPALFLIKNLDAVLSTQSYVRTKVKLMALTVLLNIALNFILVPEFGAMGAAAGTVFCNFLVCFLYLFYAEKYVFPELSLKWKEHARALIKFLN